MDILALIEKTGHKIICVDETCYTRDWDDNSQIYDSLEIQVSTRKIAAFLENNSFEFGYVASTLKDALNGQTFRYGSRKYSFGDQPEWYEALKPDPDCTDPVIRIEVETNIG